FYALLDDFSFACVPQANCQRIQVTAAPDFNQDFGATPRSCYQTVELIEAWHQLPIQGQDDIAGSEAGPVRRPILGRKDDKQRMPQLGPK
ncbi:MAG: hypothetical protein WAL20_02970, partial [Rhodomicrobium sp.]